MARKQEENDEPTIQEMAAQPLPAGVNISIPYQELDSVSTTEEALAKVTHLLADYEKKQIMTDLTPSEIPACCSISASSKRLGIDFLQQFLDEYYLLKVSKNRLGRKEIIDVARGGASTQKMGIRDKLRNMFMR